MSALTDIIFIPPLKSDLQIVVLDDHLPKLLQQLVRLLQLQLVDLPAERPERKNALPARDRIGAHHRMHRREAAPHVRRASPGLLVELDHIRVRRGVLEKPVSDASHSQPFEEFLIRL